ncbi:MAG: homogentisate 1,2-dioxygenase, partial [Bacteroidia bacterium]|nr:homogentisate 1,2-dioxygenase [Bacteroidia bacterium]
MPHYYSLGTIPPKRHTQFRKPDGSLYAEELVSTHGFSSVYSLIYHCHPPTLIKKAGDSKSIEPKIARQRHMKHESFEGFNIAPADDYLDSRKPVLINNDVHLSLAAPKKSTENYFYKNADADEVIFIHVGSGKVETIYGSLDFSYGDYVVIPRGTIYK